MNSTKRSATKPAVPENDIAPLSLRDEHRRITQERLVAAAEKLFMAQGFRATTVEQIVKAAGTTPPTFYRYFTRKAELARVVSKQLTAEVFAVLQKLAENKKPTRKSVRAWVDDYYSMWLRTHALCDAFWEAASTDATVAVEIMPTTLGITASLRGFLDRFPAADRGKIQMRLTLLVLLMDRIAFLSETEEKPDRSSRILDEFADMIWEALFRTT
jgi:AcrR family transcriptional regulator